MLNQFIEFAQGIFVQMRNAEINFSGALNETVSKYITMKAVVAEEDTVAMELREVSSVVHLFPNFNRQFLLRVCLVL